jgi:proline dehydrogenase
MTGSSLSFDDTQIAFAYKSDAELKKAFFLFRSMANAFLVKWGIRLTPWAIRNRLPVKGFIRNTIFSQFVGGETLEQTAPVVARLQHYGVQVILDYGVEGGEESDAGFDQACSEFIRVIDYAASQANIPFVSIKVTGLASFALLEKLDASMEQVPGPLMKRYEHALTTLTETESAAWQQVQDRMLRICETAAAKQVGVLVDAEETWIQDPVDVLSIRMMDRFNRQKGIVFNTAQLYRHDRLAFLKDMLEAAQLRHFLLGVKLVRGAYMEKERARAEAHHYPSPIQESKEATDRDYDAALAFCLDHVAHISAIIASHNEHSNLLAIGLMQEKGLAADHPHIHFSQLYGMSDNITFNLAKAGCSVSKYLPFGPIEEVVPYLMRRAEENSSLSGHTGRELSLIRKELERRRREKRSL